MQFARHRQVPCLGRRQIGLELLGHRPQVLDLALLLQQSRVQRIARATDHDPRGLDAVAVEGDERGRERTGLPQLEGARQIAVHDDRVAQQGAHQIAVGAVHPHQVA